MKRLALTLTLAATLALSACGHDDQRATDKAASSSDPARFQALWNEYLPLAHSLPSTWHPGNAAEANQQAGLTDTSPLSFADMSDNPGADNGGRWCLQSHDHTYLAMTYGDGDSAVLMGDGPCSYEPADAKVTANFITGEWTRGADLMGDITDAKLPH